MDLTSRKFAIVVLSYNHSPLTLKCCESVEKIFKGAPIYLVHNGSRALEIQKLKLAMPGVDHIVLNENRQFSGGANTGLSKAFENGAQDVLFLTNDTLIESFDFEKWKKVSELRSKILAPLIYTRNSKRLNSFGGQVGFKSGSLRHIKEIKNDQDDVVVINDKSFYVPGAAFIIDKEAWLKTKGFDETFGTYWEDVDLSLRARKQGVSTGVTDVARIQHGVGKTCHADPRYTVYYYHRNRRKVLMKHGDVKDLIPFGCVYTLDTLRKFFKYSLNSDFTRLKYLKDSLLS